MRELSMFDIVTPHLPVEETDGVFLDTIWVQLNDLQLNDEILDAVQRARGELKPVKKPKRNEVEDAAPLDYGDEGLDNELVNCADIDELKLRLERMRPGSFDELEAILSVYATRANYWHGVVWRRSDAEQKLRLTGEAASALLANLDDLAAARMPLEGWLTTADEARLRQALSALKPLKDFKGLPKRSGPDFVGALGMMLMRWWEATTRRDPSFWATGARKGTPTDQSQFMRFVGVVIQYLPSERRPTASKGTPGLGEQALKNRLKRSAERRAGEITLFERLSAIMGATPDDPTGSEAFRRVAKRIGESRGGARPKADKKGGR